MGWARGESGVDEELPTGRTTVQQPASRFDDNRNDKVLARNRLRIIIRNRSSKVANEGVRYWRWRLEAGIENASGKGRDFGRGVEPSDEKERPECSDPPKQELRCLVRAPFAARRAYSLPPSIKGEVTSSALARSLARSQATAVKRRPADRATCYIDIFAPGGSLLTP